MQRVHLNGIDLEYEVQGSGEPLFLIHGSILADAFYPLLNEPRITNQYRIITYHRRGFAGSSRAQAPFMLSDQAADARALLRHLGIPRAHVAGHSYGGAIALQWALDAPEDIATLALLEPPLFDAIPSGPMFWEGVASVRQDLYEPGNKAGATDAFLVGVVGAEYRQVIDKFLPPGAFELAVTDIDTFFQVEAPALQQWRLTAEAAKHIRQPVLAVVGAQTAPVFSEGHEVIKRWFPQAEELLVPQASHGLQSMNPSAVANGLANFLAKHQL